MKRRIALLMALFTQAVYAAEVVPDATQLIQQMQRLPVSGSVLMIGAHDDDDDTQLLSYLSGELHLRTGYLSLARGTGAQNRIGGERGDAMGVLLTEETLAARRIQNVEQYYTRVFDFGFSKTLTETMARWNRPEMIGDIAWIIRRFRPDIVIIRYSGTPRDGHGNHQASAHLAKQALAAASDANMFPGQLTETAPWAPKRIFELSYSPAGADVSLETGGYNPVSGLSYGEIGNLSRSAFKSQSMGRIFTPRSRKVHLVSLDGNKAPALLDGLDTTLKRVSGAEKCSALLESARDSFNPLRPFESLPVLLEARASLQSIAAESADPWARYKLSELDSVIAGCAGLWVRTMSSSAAVTPGATIDVGTEIANRCPAPIELISATLGSAENKKELLSSPIQLLPHQPIFVRSTWSVPTAQHASQPYWLKARNGDVADVSDETLIGLALDPPLLKMHLRFAVLGREFSISHEVKHRRFDPARGAVSARLYVVPEVTIRPESAIAMFTSSAPRSLKVRVTCHRDSATDGTIGPEMPEGWTCEPVNREFHLNAKGQSTDLEFTVTPPASPADVNARFVARVDGHEISVDETLIEYPHIETARLFPAAQVKLVRLPLQVLAKQIGYVMGSGDGMPAAIEQMGCDVTLLTPEDLAHADLSKFDAIVLGIRAYEVRPDIHTHEMRLKQYVANGGTMVMQYTVSARGPNADVEVPTLGAYPFRISAQRITVEDSPVKFADPQHFLLNYPNLISAADFSGWVQERGLHYAGSWHRYYEAPLEEQDPGEMGQRGGLLVGRHGKGVFIYTAHSWFRQLPAGIAGAYRIFANLLSAGTRRDSDRNGAAR